MKLIRFLFVLFYVVSQARAQVAISLTNIGPSSSPTIVLLIEAVFGKPNQVDFRKVIIEANDFGNNSHADRIKIFEISDKLPNGFQDIIFYHGDGIRNNLLTHYIDLFSGSQVPSPIPNNEYGVFKFDGHPNYLVFQKENSRKLRKLFKEIDKIIGYKGSDIQKKFYQEALNLARREIQN
ncbi:MAG: hypothetical protein QE271_11845 [Bacteriovoracaceae bacterium]|nr:hypothetical protein [Bacteriovoracaceae bacterium]